MDDNKRSTTVLGTLKYNPNLKCYLPRCLGDSEAPFPASHGIADHSRRLSLWKLEGKYAGATWQMQMPKTHALDRSGRHV